MEAIGIVINQSPGCRRGMILAPEPAAWLLLPGSGAFGLETFWLGSATSESLRDSDDDVATTEVGLATSEPNEARRRAQRECGRQRDLRRANGTMQADVWNARLRRVQMRVRDLGRI